MALLLFGCGGGDSDKSANATGAETGASSTAANESSESGGETGEADADGAGGEESESTESAAPQSAQIKEMDALCGANGQKVTNEVFRLFGKEAGSKAATEATAVNNVIVPKLEEEASQLGELSVPAAQQEALSALLAGYQQAIAEAKANPQKFFQSGNPYAALEQPAKELGLANCPG